MAEKFRYWACILYPDEPNFPDNFLDIIDSWHIDCILSPLHSPDPVPDHAEEKLELQTHKKRHYHLLILWNGPTTYQTIKNLLDDLGPCVTNPFFIRQVNGYIRYLVHLDNPEKEQFNDYKHALGCFGKSYEQAEEAFSVGEFDKIKIIHQINRYILENNITEFCDLLVYSYNNEPKWSYLLDGNPPRSITELIRSMRYGRK